MPDNPKCEEIEAAVEGILKGISQANGYWYDYKNVEADHDLRKLKDGDAVNEFPALFCPPGIEGPAGLFTAGTISTAREERELQLPVIAYSKEAGAHGTQTNKIRQDVERAMFAAGPPILGVSGVTRLTVATVERWQDLEAQNTEHLRIIFVATYRYDRGDP